MLNFTRVNPSKLHVRNHQGTLLANSDTNGDWYLMETFQQSTNTPDLGGWVDESDPGATVLYNASIDHPGHGTQAMYCFSGSGTAYNTNLKANLSPYTPQAAIVFYFRILASGDNSGPSTWYTTFFQAIDGDDVGVMMARWYSDTSVVVGVWTGATFVTQSGNLSENVWYRFEVTFDADGTDTMTIYQGDTETVMVTVSQANHNDRNLKQLRFGTRGTQINTAGYFNDIFIRTSNTIVPPPPISFSRIITDGNDSTLIRTDEPNYGFLFKPESISHTGTVKAVRVNAEVARFDDQHYQVRFAMSTGASPDLASEPGDVGYGQVWFKRFSLKDSYLHTFAQFFDTPEVPSRAQLDWDDIDNISFGFKLEPQWDQEFFRQCGLGGVSLRSLSLDVIYGNATDAMLTHGPSFPWVTDSSIRVWLRVNQEARVKLLYGPSEAEVLASSNSTQVGDTDITSAMTLSYAANGNCTGNYCGYFDITTGLSAGTPYYFNILIEQGTLSNVWLDWRDFEYTTMGNTWLWDTLPKCITAITEGSTADFTWANGADKHGDPYYKGMHPHHYSIYDNIAAENPAFFVMGGDPFHCDAADEESLNTVWDGYLWEMSYDCEGYHYWKNILTRMPVYNGISDHNLCENNSNKFSCTTSEFAVLESYNPHFISQDVFKAVWPHEYYAPSDLTGTADASSDETTLICTSMIEWQFSYTGGSGSLPQEGDNILINGDLPGTVSYVDGTTSSGIMIVNMSYETTLLSSYSLAVSARSWTATISASGQLGFPTVGEHGIYAGLLAHKTSGTVAAALIRTIQNTTIFMGTPLTDAQSFANATFRLARWFGSYTFNWGNACVLMGECRFKRDPDKTRFGDKFDGTVWPNVSDSFHKGHYICTSNAGLGITTDTDTIVIANLGHDIVPGDGIKNVTRSGYSLVKNVTEVVGTPTSYTVLELVWPINDTYYSNGNQTVNDSIDVYQSGASDYGSDAANIAHGFVNRTFWQSTLRDTTQDWRLLCVETPFNIETSYHDKWADYDGNTIWKLEDTWVSVGSNYYCSNTSFPECPGGVDIRFGDFYFDHALVHLVDDITDLGADDLRQWWYGSYGGYNNRVWVYRGLGGELETPGNAAIFYPNFWELSACRRFAVSLFEKWNTIWYGWDIHVIFLKTPDEHNPCPQVGCSPLFCGAMNTHCCSWDYYTVDGLNSFHDRGLGTTYPYNENFIGGYCITQVLNSGNRIINSIKDWNGDGINGIDKYGRSGLAPLTMNTSFVTRMLDETFNTPPGSGSPSGCDYVWSLETS